MTAAELHGRLAAQGIRLSARDGQLCYRGPRDAVTDDVLDLLKRHKKLLVEWLDPRGKPIAHLLGRLCGYGVWASRDGKAVVFREHRAGSLALVDEILISELRAREDQLVAFLQKTENELADGELDALGYRRASPDSRILLGSDDDEPASWIWKAPCDSTNPRRAR